MVRRSGLCLSVSLLLCAPLLAADFKSLRKQYEDAKAKIGGLPQSRREKVEKSIVPILHQIGEVDTKESLAFLLGELKTAIPEIGAACADPILASKSDDAPRQLLAAFTEKNRPVAVGILEAFGRAKRDLKVVETELVRSVQGVTELEVKKAVPPAAGRIDSVASARAIFGLVQTPKGSKGEDLQAVCNTRAILALRNMKSAEVKEWLAKDAFHAAGGDAGKLQVAASLAGELSIAEARPELEKLLGNSNSDVSGAAIGSLIKLGIGDDIDGIAKALEKHKGKGDASFRILTLDALGRSGTDAAINLLVKSAESSDAEMRAIAMGSLALAKGSPRAHKALGAGLVDEDPSVRAAALRAVSGLKEKSLIGPLIAVLEKEKEERLKIAAGELLARLTGQGQIGLVHEDWRKWWDGAEARFEFPKDEAGSVTSVKAKRSLDLTYFGMEVSSKRVAFLVDVSGSMLEEVPVRLRPPQPAGGAKEGQSPESGKTSVGGGGGSGGGGSGAGADGGVTVKNGKAKKIDILKSELARLLKKLPPDMHINIVTFDGNFHTWQPQLQPMAGPGKQKAVAFVQGLKTGHGTNVFDSVEAALKDRRVDTIYLLTDGLPTAGRLLDPPAILKEIQSQNRVRNATINCIAFGEESPLLKDIAAQNGGEYRFVNSYDS